MTTREMPSYQTLREALLALPAVPGMGEWWDQWGELIAWLRGHALSDDAEWDLKLGLMHVLYGPEGDIKGYADRMLGVVKAQGWRPPA